MYNSNDLDCERSSGWQCCLPRLAYWLLPLLALVSLCLPTSDLPRIFSSGRGVLGWLRRLHGWEHYQLPKEENSPRHRRLTEDERLILYGDSNAETAVARQKAILERWPDNPVYRGNYITELISKFGREADVVTSELVSASQAEPDNARYPLLLAANKADQATSRGEEDELLVDDRTLLDEAMLAMLDALDRPVFKRYAYEMLMKRMDILGTPRSLAESMERNYFAGMTLLPDLSCMRFLVRVSGQYALLLANEGNAEDAVRFASAWQRLAEHLQEDAYCLLDVLVVSSLIAIGEDSSEVFDLLNRPEEAEHMRTVARNWNEPVRVWRERSSDRHHFTSPCQWYRLPRGEPISDTELKAGRLMEYTLFEQASVAIFHALVVILMISCWLSGMSWRLREKQDKPNITLYPRFSDYLRMLGYGLLVPLMVYAVLVNITWVGGRQWSVEENYIRAFAQIGTTLAVALALTLFFAHRALSARARGLGIATPPAKASIRFVNRLSFILMVAAVMLAFLPHPTDTPGRWSVIPTISLFMLGGVALIRCLFVLCRLPAWLTSRLWGGYYGAMARSTVSVLAAMAIVLSWGLMPVLRWRETSHVAEMVWGSSSATGLPTVEERLTQRLLDDMKARYETLTSEDVNSYGSPTTQIEYQPFEAAAHPLNGYGYIVNGKRQPGMNVQ